MATMATGGGAAHAARASAVALVGALAVMAANLGYSDFLASRENSARAAAAELQGASQQLARFAQLAVRGDADAFDAFAETRRRIDTLVQGLDRDYGNDAMQPGTASAMKDVAEVWHKMAQDALRIERGRERVLASDQTANAIQVRTPQIAAQLSEVIRGMADGGASVPQINIANRQVVLADRMSRRVAEILAGGDAAVAAADALQRDEVVFGQVLQGLREGAPEVGLERVTHPAAAAALAKVDALFADQRRDIDALLEGSTQLVETQEAAAALADDSDVLLEDAQGLYASIGAVIGRVFPNPLIGIVTGLFAVLALAGLLLAMGSMQRELARLSR